MKPAPVLIITVFYLTAAMSCGLLDQSKSKSPIEPYVVSPNSETNWSNYRKEPGYLGEFLDAEFKSSESMPCGYYYNARSLKVADFVTQIGSFKVVDSQEKLNLQQSQVQHGTSLSLADERGNGGWVIQCSLSQTVDFDRRVDVLGLDLASNPIVVIPSMPRVLDYFEGCVEAKFANLPLVKFPPLLQKEGPANLSMYDFKSSQGWKRKEGRQQNIEPELTEGGKNPIELALAIVARLQSFDAARATLYAAKVNDFLTQAQFFEGDIVPSEDTNRTFIPKGCKAQQVISQRKPELPGDKRYYVHSNFLKLLADDQAGLILHEIIYQEALSLGKTNSRGARYFNAWLSSHETFTADEYQDVLNIVGFPTVVQPF